MAEEKDICKECEGSKSKGECECPPEDEDIEGGETEEFKEEDII